MGTAPLPKFRASLRSGLLTGETQSDLVMVASTLAITALFGPLRHRVLNVIDRRCYRRTYDAQTTLQAFSAKTRTETDVDQLTADLVHVTQETLTPAQVSLWIKPDVPSDYAVLHRKEPA